MARTKSTLTGPSKALWPGMCHQFGGLARLGSTGSFQRSPEPQLLLWPKAASAAVNALRRNRTSGTPKGVPTMWATRGVRGPPAHRGSPLPWQGGVIPYCRSMSELYEQTELTADLTAYCRRNDTYENRVYTLLQINENARRAHIRFVPFAIPPLTPPWCIHSLTCECL